MTAGQIIAESEQSARDGAKHAEKLGIKTDLRTAFNSSVSVAKPAGKLKAVLDTNVYFSAFSSRRGVPFDLWRRAAIGEYSLLVSPAILRELADVLRTDLEWPEREIGVTISVLTPTALPPQAPRKSFAASPSPMKHPEPVSD